MPLMRCAVEAAGFFGPDAASQRPLRGHQQVSESAGGVGDDGFMLGWVNVSVGWLNHSARMFRFDEANQIETLAMTEDMRGAIL